MGASILWISVIFLLAQGLGALAVDPPAANFTLTLRVTRSGNDVTASWEKLSRPVTNITIRVCPKLESCSVNPRVEEVKDLSALSVQFEVEQGKFYIYSMAVISGGRTYTSRPVEAEIQKGLSTGNTVMIVVAVVVVVVVVILVIVLVICLRRRFVTMKDQYAFTEMDKKERKKSQKRAMAEIVSPRDVKGVLHVSDQNYAVLDENPGKTNGYTNKMALQTLEEEEAFPEIDGRLQIVEPDSANNAEQVHEAGAPESPDPTLLNPKLHSMGLSLDSDDDQPDLDLQHDVTPDVVRADVTIATESEPQSPGAVSLEVAKPDLQAIQASSFAESDSEDEDHKGDISVTTPDVAMETPDIDMEAEAEVVMETPEVFRESNPNFEEPDMSGGNDVIEIPEMDIADAFAEMDAVTDEQDGGRESVISSTSSSSTSSSSSSSSDPETDKPEPETGKPEPETDKQEPETGKPEPETDKPEVDEPEVDEPAQAEMADIDLQAMEND